MRYLFSYRSCDIVSRHESLSPTSIPLRFNFGCERVSAVQRARNRIFRAPCVSITEEQKGGRHIVTVNRLPNPITLFSESKDLISCPCRCGRDTGASLPMYRGIELKSLQPFNARQCNDACTRDSYGRSRVRACIKRAKGV